MSDSDYDIPHLPRRNRKNDDPKVIGLWKIGRTIGQGASGKSSPSCPPPSSIAHPTNSSTSLQAESA